MTTLRVFRGVRSLFKSALPGYRLVVEPVVHRDMKRVPPDVAPQVEAAIYSLETEPRPQGVKPFQQGKKNDYRIRLGRWRVFFNVNDKAREVHIFGVILKTGEKIYDEMRKRRKGMPHF